MTDRDRLIQLLKTFTDNNNGGGSNHERADYLLANGVIVPLCKVGDILWIPSVNYNKVYSKVIFGECFENECPLVSEKGCKVGREQTLYPYALDLINRLQKIVEKCEKVERFADKAIATLQAENEELKQIAEHQQDVSMKRYFEIKRLKEDRSRCGMDKHDAAELAYKNGQKQGVKEFAERLKQGLPTWLHPYVDMVQKEMKGEE